MSSLLQKGSAVAHDALNQHATDAVGFLQGLALPWSVIGPQRHTLVVAHATGYSLAGLTVQPTVIALGGVRLSEHLAMAPAGLRSPGGADR